MPLHGQATQDAPLYGPVFCQLDFLAGVGQARYFLTVLVRALKGMARR